MRSRVDDSIHVEVKVVNIRVIILDFLFQSLFFVLSSINSGGDFQSLVLIIIILVV